MQEEEPEENDLIQMINGIPIRCVINIREGVPGLQLNDL